MAMNRRISCPDCRSVDRREFIKTVGGAALAGAASAVVFDPRFAHAAPTPQSSAETVVGQFFQSLTPQQREKICLPFDHDLRGRISANWHVTEPLIGEDFYTSEQRALIQQIVKNVTSQDGFERLLRQTDDDDGGLQNYSVAIFGEPGTGKFQWELTGRHLTLRADGDSVDRAAFGGPIVYGHGEESDVAHNLYHYQTKRANEVFRALDPQQAQLALIKDAPSEAAVQLQGAEGRFSGIQVDQLSADQQQLVRDTLKLLLDPYRAEDVEEAMGIVEAGGGLGKLRMAFYQEGDIDADKVWDIWRIEGPNLVCHFRGAPHVHAYINIGVKDA
jgi:hypothetical protein